MGVIKMSSYRAYTYVGSQYSSGEGQCAAPPQ